MIISIANPAESTWIFTTILAIAILISSRWKKKGDFFPISTTNELKGLAILTVVFSHIGYFLTTNNSFLFPLSTISGIGVDIFLFLSGMGLTMSSIKKELPIGKFYRDRLLKLFLPLWMVLITFFTLDFLILKINYGWPYIIKSLLGFFQSASLYKDVDSPLWYFTLILFYYLLYPLVFLRKKPWLSAVIIYLAGFIILKLNPSAISSVSYFFGLHFAAFPLGIIFGWLLSDQKLIGRIKKYAVEKKYLSLGIRYVFIILLLGGFYYLQIHSEIGKGQGIEQLASIIGVFLLVALFWIKKTESEALSFLGKYSYEIYLLHWSILYRYDILYNHTPGWLATSSYLVLFVILGWALQKISKTISDKIISK